MSETVVNFRRNAVREPDSAPGEHYTFKSGPISQNYTYTTQQRMDMFTALSEELEGITQRHKDLAKTLSTSASSNTPSLDWLQQIAYESHVNKKARAQVEQALSGTELVPLSRVICTIGKISLLASIAAILIYALSGVIIIHPIISFLGIIMGSGLTLMGKSISRELKNNK